MNLDEMKELRAYLMLLKDNASQGRRNDIYNVLDEVERQINAMEGN